MACENTSQFENIEITCALKHQGTTAGFFNETPVTQPAALTSPDNGTVGTLLWTSAEAAIVTNMRTRINELESKLTALGLLA